MPEKCTLLEGNDALFGNMLYFALRGSMKGADDSLVEQIKTGHWSCVFDADGNFLSVERQSPPPI